MTANSNLTLLKPNDLPDLLTGNSHHYVHYGDFIILQGVLTNHSSEESTGVLSAVGFTDKRVFFQKLPFNILHLEGSSNEEELSLINNYRDFVFQIWPKLNFEAHKEYRKALRMKNTYMAIKASNDPSEKSIAKEYELSLLKLSNRCEEEKKANLATFNSFLGQKVSFGTEIQFMHKDSGLFLTGRATTASFDKSAYRLELSANYNSGMMFQINSKFKSRQDGEPIQYNDQVLLKNMKLDCYVNFNEEVTINLDTEVQKNPDIELKVPYKQITLRNLGNHCKRFEAHISQPRETSWRMRFHANPPDNPKAIRSRELIRLKHTELQCYLAADINYENDNPELYVRMYKGPYSEESKSVAEIWEIEALKLKAQGEPIRAAQGASILEEIFSESRYRLRHFLTGRLVTLQKVKISGTEKIVPVLVDDAEDEAVRKSSSISFVPTIVQDKNHVLDGSSYSIGFTEDPLYLSTIPEHYYYMEGPDAALKAKKRSNKRHATTKGSIVMESLDVYKNEENTSSPKEYYMPLKDSEFGVQRYATCLERATVAEHAFAVERVPKDEQNEILLAMSAISHLQLLRKQLRENSQACLTHSNLKSVIHVLSSLILFAVKTDQSDADPFLCEGFTYPHRQRLLKDMALIEILTDILYYPFEYQLFKLNNIPNPLMVQVFQLSHKLIKHTIREYRPNELYASQWLELFIHQSMFSDPNYDLLAEATLTELIDNNKRILESKIKIETIARFVGMLKYQNPHSKYVNLLRALTVCNGEPVLANQAEISRAIFEDEETRDAICYRLKIDSDGPQDIYVFANKYDEWVLLKSFAAVAVNNDGDDTLYKYFVSLIYLLADLCLQRNFIAIGSLEQIYTYDVCFEIALTNKFSDDLRAAFAKLFNCLWLDRDYQPMPLPNFLITWDEVTLANSQDFYKYIPETDDKFQNVKPLLLEYFQEVAEIGYQKAFLTDRNQLTLILLDSCKTLINFGFYSTKVSLGALLKPLLRMLNGLKDITTPDEEELQLNNWKPISRFSFVGSESSGRLDKLGQTCESRFKETPETHLLMEVKVKILEILDIVMKYCNDFRVRRFLYEFKQESENISLQESKDSSVFNFPSTRRALIRSNTSKHQNDESTPQAWVRKIFSSGDFVIGDYSQPGLDLILFDLIQYEHKGLQTTAFDFLFKNHTQCLTLKEMLNYIYIIDDAATAQKIEEIRRSVARLTELTDTIDSWYGEGEIMGQANNEAVKILLNLCTYLRLDQEGYGGDMDMSPTEMLALKADLPIQTDQLMKAFGDDIIPNADYQKVMRHLKVHTAVISILNYDVKGRFESKETRSSFTRNLLIACIKLLIRFISENKENQDIIAQHSDIFLKLMKRDPSLGVENLICGLFAGNRQLLEDQAAVQNFLNSVAKLVDALPLHDSRRGKLILTFSKVAKFGEAAIKKNQMLILQALSRKEYSSVLFNFNYHRTLELLTEEITIYHNHIQEKKEVINLPGELDYLSSLLCVLAMICEEQNAAAQARCQTLFPLKLLKDLYQKAGSCFHLKDALLQFIQFVYLDSDREFKEEIEALFELVELMLQDLHAVVEHGWMTGGIRDHDGIMPVRKVQSDFICGGVLNILSILLTKKEIVLHEHFEQWLKQIKTDLQKLRKITKNTSNHREINRLRNVIATHQSQNIETIEGMYTETSKTPKRIVDRLVLPSFAEPESQTFTSPSSPRSSFMRNMPSPIRSYLKSSAQQKSKVRHLAYCIEQLSDEKSSFQKSAENEFDSLVQQLVHLEKLAIREDVSISYQKVVQALIALIETQENPLNDNLRAVGLRILRRIIELEVPTCKKPAVLWKTKDWIAYQKKISARQNEFCQLGVVKMLCKLFSETKNHQILQEAVMLSVSMLIGGNLEVQSVFFSTMQEDMTNQFLLTLKTIITGEFEELKKNMNRLNHRLSDGLLVGKELRERIHQVRKNNKKLLQFKTIELALKTELEEADMELKRESRDSIGLLTRVFRFLQLLCEGHYSEMQNHLRNQFTSNNVLNSKSFNFIAYATVSFGAYAKFANIECLEFGQQLLEFLIECVQGPCKQNQETLVNAKIIDFCIDYASLFSKPTEQKRRGFETPEELQTLNASITQSLKLLYTLLEGKPSKIVLHQMSTHIDFDFLLKKITSDFENFCKRNRFDKRVRTQTIIEKLKANSFDDIILQSFPVFILFLTLAESNPQLDELIKKGAVDGRLEASEVKAISFFLANIGNIEIMFNDELLRVYFPILPTTRFLSVATRNKLMEEVPRESANEKIAAFLRTLDKLFDEMKHFGYLNRQLFKISEKKFDLLRNTALVVALIIHIIFYATYEWTFVNSSEVMTHTEIFGGNTYPVLKVSNVIAFFSILQLCLSCLLVLFWLILHGPLTIKEGWRQLVRKAELSGKIEGFYDEFQQGYEHLDPEDLDIEEFSTNETVDLLLRFGPYSPIFQKNGKKNFGNGWTRFVYYWKNLRFLYDNSTFRFVLFHLFISIYALSALEIVFALQLLDIVARFGSLRTAVESITINGKQLLLMFLLGLVVQYHFASFGFWFINSLYDDYFNNERICSSLLQCLVTTVNNGLRVRGGGIGERVQIPSYAPETREMYWIKIIWEYLSFLCVNTVFLYTITAIIIDTFARLRQKKQNIQQDMYARCFVCDLERSYLDKHGKGFEQHVRNDHDPWSYANYVYYLKQTDPMDYNGIESFVMLKLAEEDTRWIPNGKCWEIHRKEFDIEEDMKEQKQEEESDDE